jgi:hypothetical protein
VALLEFRDQGLIAVCLVWLLTYPLLLAGHLAVTARLIPLRLSSYARALLPGMLGGALLAAAALGARALLPVPDASLLGLVGSAGAGLLAYGAYLRWGLGLRLRQLAAAPTTGPGPRTT